MGATRKCLTYAEISKLSKLRGQLSKGGKTAKKALAAIKRIVKNKRTVCGL